MTINNKVALKIKEYRDFKNISQAALAKQLLMSNSAYSRLENGEIQITLTMLEKIAEKLNVTMLELLDFKSSQINNFNNNSFAQSGNSTINITLTPDEFQKVYAEVNKANSQTQ